MVAAGPAAAQETPSLPAVTVSGEGVAARDTPTLGKLPLALREIPQSVTVIGLERMREQNLQSLDDVMQQTPGITVQPYQLLTTAYYARGFKVDSFEQDGVPVLMGNMAASPQDMAVYERVEILRGANGLLHGAGNPAATVNLVRKRPQREFAFGGSVSAGSWDRYRAEADLGGPLNDSGSVRGRVVGAVDSRGYFYDVADQKSALFYGIGEIDLGPDTVLSAGVQAQRIRSTTNMAGVPRYKDGGDIGLKRSTYLDASWDRFNWDTTRVFADLEHRFGGGWRAKVSANYLTGSSNLKYAGAYGGIDRQTGQGSRLMGGAYKFDDTQASLDAYVSGPVELFGRRHELLLGGNMQRSTSEQRSAMLTPALNVPVDVFNWDPRGVPEPGTGPYVSSGQTVLKQQGVYGMGRFSLADPLTLVLGGRMSGWNQQARAGGNRIDPEFTPYGGLILTWTGNGRSMPATRRCSSRRASARATASRSILSRAPTTKPASRASWPTARSTCRWPSSRSSRRTAHSRIRTGPAWATTATTSPAAKCAAAASRPRSRAASRRPGPCPPATPTTPANT